jgi:hypothetical protein
MSTRFFLLLALLALFVPQMLSTAAQAPPSAAATTQQAEVGTIQGIVVREGTGEPIPDVQIMLAGPNASPTPDALLNTLASLLATLPPDQALAVEGIARGGLPGQVVSDSEGRFTIQKAPAGPRTVRARREGYFAPLANGTYPADAIVPVTVKANETSNVRVVLVPGASVSGRVLDPAGRPLADAMIQIQRAAYVNGSPSLEIVNAGRTDDRGEYRLYRLAPGDFYISASPRPQIALAGPAKVDPNLREVPTTTFYPNTTDAGCRIPSGGAARSVVYGSGPSG